MGRLSLPGKKYCRLTKNVLVEKKSTVSAAKIRQRDEQLAMERAKFEEEQRQNGSSEASAEGEDEAAAEEEEEENGKESDGKPDGAEPAVGADSESSCPPEDSSK